MLFVAWDLSLRDLKKIAINGLIYSSCDDKDMMVEEFKKRWQDYIQEVIEKYGEQQI